MNKSIILLMICTSLFSCFTDINQNRNVEEEERPRAPVPFLIDTLILSNNDYCFIETPLIYEEKLILMIRNDDAKEGYIKCYDKHSLNELWTWREAFDEFGHPARGFGTESHIYEGVLAIAQSNLSYGIDIETGQTVWKNREGETGFSVIKGFGETITNVHIKDFNVHNYVKVANIREGQWKNTYDMVKEDELDIGLKAPEVFEWNDVDYMAFVSIKWSASPPLEIHWLNLYNLTEDRMEWTSDTIPLYHPLSGTPGSLIKFEEGQILLANDAIYSYNVEDGSLEWWKRYTNRFVFSSHLTASDGKVFGNNEDQFFVGLDVHTGEELFNTPTGGSASLIAHHDGKCYMSDVTAEGLDWLMILDCTTGELLHKIGPPYVDEHREWNYDGAITVDPETGLVYTADHRYLLVYDFEE